MNLECSVYKALQIIVVSLINETHLSDLVDKSNFKNFKDRYDSSEQNLFNFLPCTFLVNSSEFSKVIDCS